MRIKHKNNFCRKNPEEFLARIEAKTSKEAAAAKPKDFSLPGVAKQKLDSNSSGQPRQKSLDSIVKLELFADKSAKEIEEIWCKHFASKVSC